MAASAENGASTAPAEVELAVASGAAAAVAAAAVADEVDPSTVHTPAMREHERPAARFFERRTKLDMDDAVKDTKDEEAVRFQKLHSDYQALPFNQNKRKRTGWSRPMEGYTPLCCGNSAFDWLVIVVCLLLIYVFTGLIFWGLLSFYLSTDDNFAALYFNIFLLFLGWGSLAAVVYLGYVAKAEEEAASGSKTGDDAA